MNLFCCCCPCWSSNSDDEERLRIFKHSSSNASLTDHSYTSNRPYYVINDVGKKALEMRERVLEANDNVEVDDLKLSMLPVGLREVDKRFQDHATLYNDQLTRLDKLQCQLEELCFMYPRDNPKFNIEGAFEHIRNICEVCPNETKLVRVSDCCLEIEFDPRRCPAEALPAFLAFNGANRRTREILERGPSLARLLKTLLEQGSQLKRDVSASGGSKLETRSFEQSMDKIERTETALDNLELNLKMVEGALLVIDLVQVKAIAVWNDLDTFKFADDGDDRRGQQ